MTGTVTLSIEIELGWGMHDLNRFSHLSDDGELERKYLRKLLDACDVEGIPITFDVVGHLLLHTCSGTHEGPYPAGWFDADPGTDATTDPLFYAPDMVEEIQGRETAHELATHGFAHIPSKHFSDEFVDNDLSLAQRQHRKFCGERARSYVPPRNRPPSADVLRQNNIKTVRVARTNPAQSSLHRYGHLLAGSPPADEPPYVADEVIRTKCVNYQTLTAPSLPWGQKPAHPTFRPLPVRFRQRLHERSLRQAIDRTAETDGNLHLWCHLWDLSNPQQWASLRRVLSIFSKARDDGRIQLTPMRDLRWQLEEKPQRKALRA